MDIVIGIILLLVSVFLVVAVLMQHGKSKNLSGTIAGGAETFFGKSKAQTIDKKLSKLTTVVAIVFVIIVVILYVVQPDTDYDKLYQEALDSINAELATAESGDGETTVADGETTAATGEETTAAEGETSAAAEDTTVAEETTATEGETTAAAEETTAAE